MDQMRHPVIDRFATACQADARVVAAFVSGSYARGTADAHSDIDLGLITTERTYRRFVATRADFVRLLGKPIFLEDFDAPETLFFILSDGTEGELAVGHERSFEHLAAGACRVLLDRKGILAGMTMRGARPDPGDQREAVRRLIVWFWHDLSHFITALARGQPWWAYGQLEVLRRSCLSLARLRHDFGDSNTGVEAYFKVDVTLPSAQLSLFAGSICPMEPLAMLLAARTMLQLYRDMAPGVADAHDLAYPLALERLMLERLEATPSERFSSAVASA